jgi:Cu/Ag efflux pump CusA
MKIHISRGSSPNRFFLSHPDAPGTIANLKQLGQIFDAIQLINEYVPGALEIALEDDLTMTDIQTARARLALHQLGMTSEEIEKALK